MALFLKKIEKSTFPKVCQKKDIFFLLKNSEQEGKYYFHERKYAFGH